MEEIVNAMGVDGYHDGVNYMRAVCVIVIEAGLLRHRRRRLQAGMLHIVADVQPRRRDDAPGDGAGAGAERAPPTTPPMALVPPPPSSRAAAVGRAGVLASHASTCSL